MSVVSILAALIEIKENYNRLREMLYFQQEAKVLRNNTIELIDSKDLVPGDIIQLIENSKLTCDLILIKGTCVVEEAVITGESAPISKHELSNTDELFENKMSNPSLLYNGTYCLKTKNNALALVYRTGFLTLKGQIAKEIVFQKVKRISFLEDSFKYILVFAVLTLIGFSFTTSKMIEAHFSTKRIILRLLDLITVSIPPALTVAMEVGIVFAVKR